MNVLSSQKSVPGIERPEANLGVPSKKQNSVPSSRSSRKRLELENEIRQDEARADIERKQHNLKLRCKRREMENELEAKKKEKVFAEVKQQRELLLKLKKQKLRTEHLQRVVFATLVGLFVCWLRKLDDG